MAESKNIKQRLLLGFEFMHVDCDGVNIHCAIAGPEQGEPLLMLHGHPQTLLVWRKVAQDFVDAGYRVVLADLRGYGDSDKPASDPEHLTYSKRMMARDQVTLMKKLGFDTFTLIGHDRGGRVGHRMALDFPDVVQRVVVIDIAPTATMYARTDKDFATRYFWWFFLIQDAPLPERMILADTQTFLRSHVDVQLKIKDAVSDEVFQEYLRVYKTPEMVSAVCEDYRAAATIDLEHDKADADQKVQAPLLALWGSLGVVGKTYDVLQTWREKANKVEGEALPCGHCLQEELPELFTQKVLEFLNAHN